MSLFIVFEARLSSAYASTKMEYDKHFTEIESDFFAGIIENLEANGGKTLF